MIMKELYAQLGIYSAVYDFGKSVEDSLKERFEKFDKTAEYNQMKVIRAMQKNRVSEACFGASSGYGYNDLGRETLEQVYADTFHTEACLVRPQITCGTHAPVSYTHLNDAFLLSGVDVEDLKGRLGICVFALDPWYFDDQLCQKTLKEHFHVGNLEGLGIGDYDSGIIASGALFLYLKETQKTALSHMASIRPYSAEKYMLIDSSSRRNLELVETCLLYTSRCV